MTINAVFPTSETLPNWIKVTKICFNPKETHIESLSLEHASKLVVDIFNHPVQLKEVHLANIAKMKNLETIQFRNNENFYVFGKYRSGPNF